MAENLEPIEPFDEVAFAEKLARSLEGLFTAPPLPPDRIEKLIAFGARLSRVSREINLTRILDPEAMAVRHFLDSYQLLHVLRESRGPVVDIGSGGGVPGIPLAIFRPDLRVVLIDGTAKKVRYLADWIRELSLSNAAAFHARAEEFLRKKEAVSYALVTRAAVKPRSMMEILHYAGTVAEKLIFMEGEAGPETGRSVIDRKSVV